jgi:hypothetical protein
MREIVVGLSRMLEPRKVFEEHLAKAKNPLDAPVDDRVLLRHVSRICLAL